MRRFSCQRRGSPLAKPRLLITIRRRHRREFAVEFELPGMVRAGEQAAGSIAFVFVTQHGPCDGDIGCTERVPDLPHHDQEHRLAADHESHVVAGLADLRFMTVY